jgi:hypothetical protein
MSATRRSIDQLVDDACRRLTRLSRERAFQAHHAGAILIEIRPQASRELEGALPGTEVVERTELEWRLDPASNTRLPIASYDLHVVVLCATGYSASHLAGDCRIVSRWLSDGIRQLPSRLWYRRLAR